MGSNLYAKIIQRKYGIKRVTIMHYIKKCYCHFAYKRVDYLLWICLAIAFVVRWWGLEFGLPHRYHIDEPPSVIAALKIAQGDFKITYPPLSPSLHQVVLFVLYSMLFIVQYSLGIVNIPSDFAMLYQKNPGIFYIITRGLSVVGSLLTLFMLYRLVKQILGRRSALLAVFFLTFCFLDVRHAHFGKFYTLLSLSSLICINLSLKFVRTDKKIYLVMAGLVTGVSVGMRYSLISLCLAPLTAIVYNILIRKTVVHKHIANAFLQLSLSTCFGFVLGSPSLVLNTNLALKSAGVWIGYALNDVGFEGFQFTKLSSLGFYSIVLETAWGIPLLLCIFLGVIRIFKKRDFRYLIIFGFPIVYSMELLIASSASAVFARYLVPILPFFALLAAEGALGIIEKFDKNRDMQWSNMLMVLFVLFLVIIPLSRIIQLDYLWTQRDTRTLAKEWIESNIPEGSKIASQWHSPPLATNSDFEPNSIKNFDVIIIDPFDPSVEPYTFDYYKENNFDYIVLSSFIYKLDRIDSHENEVRSSFYDKLDNKATLIAEICPYKNDEPPFFFEEIWGPFLNLWERERPGPTIKVYRF